MRVLIFTDVNSAIGARLIRTTLRLAKARGEIEVRREDFELRRRMQSDGPFDRRSKLARDELLSDAALTPKNTLSMSTTQVGGIPFTDSGVFGPCVTHDSPAAECLSLNGRDGCEGGPAATFLLGESDPN